MPRGIWKGTLGFGLVNIGVELFTAEEPERLDIDLLDKRDMARVGYQQINKTTGLPIGKEDVVRGVAIDSGKYVLLDPKELKAANPVATQTIEILGFVNADAIPPIYYAKPYYVAPLKGSEKAFRLFATALEQSERIGLAQLVIHIRQYVAAVYPLEDTIVVQLLRYAAELREHVKVGGGSQSAPKPAELTMANQLIDSMETDWEPESFRDTYRDDIMRLVKKRSSKAKASTEPAPAPEKEPVVLDLMAALKRSIANKGSGGGKSTARARAGSRRRLKSAG